MLSTDTLNLCNELLMQVNLSAAGDVDAFLMAANKVAIAKREISLALTNREAESLS